MNRRYYWLLVWFAPISNRAFNVVTTTSATPTANGFSATRMSVYFTCDCFYILARVFRTICLCTLAIFNKCTCTTYRTRCWFLYRADIFCRSTICVEPTRAFPLFKIFSVALHTRNFVQVIDFQENENKTVVVFLFHFLN